MRKPSPALLIAVLALFVALGGAGMAATGGNFILGKPNAASSNTSLSAPIAGKALQVSNTSTGAGATALGLTAASGHAPFTVNTGVKVANLNADKLDGIDSSYFLPGSHVLRGVVNANAAGGTRLFLDPVTHADVRHYGAGVVTIRNANSQDHLYISGISILGGDEAHWSQELGPNATVSFFEQTIEPRYLDLMVMRLGADPGKAVSLHLTCGVADNGATAQVALSCLGMT